MNCINHVAFTAGCRRCEALNPQESAKSTPTPVESPLEQGTDDAVLLESPILDLEPEQSEEPETLQE